MLELFPESEVYVVMLLVELSVGAAVFYVPFDILGADPSG